MAWATPHAWTVGEVPTAALLNQDLRDNALWLKNGAPACRISTSWAGTAAAVGVSFDPIFIDASSGDNFDQGYGPTMPSAYLACPRVGYWYVNGVAQGLLNLAASTHRFALIWDSVYNRFVNASGTVSGVGLVMSVSGIFREPTVGAVSYLQFFNGGPLSNVCFTMEQAWLRGL